jgi:hypothetical protein
VYVGYVYGYPGYLGVVALSSDQELTWHDLYNHVCRLIPEYNFDEDENDLYVYIIPEGLKGCMGAVCASLGTHANGEGVGLPALYKPYKFMDDKLERYFDEGRMYTLYIYLSQRKCNFMKDRRYIQATGSAVYRDVPVAVVEQAMKSLCARSTVSDNPFHNKCAERHWVFTPPVGSVAPSIDRLTKIADEEEFIELLSILREEPYTVPSIATLAMHRVTPTRWNGMRRSIPWRSYPENVYTLIDREANRGASFLNTTRFCHSSSMSTTVLIVIACILGVLAIVLLGAVAYGVWLVCHILKELNGYSNV